MLNSIERTLHPERYHGHGQAPPFFEGWYFKVVDAPEEHAYAFIPGVFLGSDLQERHAFVQVLDGHAKATYHRYPYESFWAAENRFEIRVGPNRFTTERILLDIEDEERPIAGELRFQGLAPWPVGVLSPGAMGWFAWMPFMETYHGVLSMNHRVLGTLAIAGEEITFDDGWGYTEKDWGRAFPSGWVWMQTNHFEQPGTSVSISTATIPWLGRSFPGLLAGIYHDGRFYSLATYNGARVERLEVTARRIVLAAASRRHRLEIVAQRSESGILHGPTGLRMVPFVFESLSATMQVRFWALEKGTARLIFSGSGRNAGLEVNGDISRLLV